MLLMNYILELSLALIRISEELEMEHGEWGQTSQLTYDEACRRRWNLLLSYLILFETREYEIA